MPTLARLLEVLFRLLLVVCLSLGLLVRGLWVSLGFGVWGQGAQDDGLREQKGSLGGFSAGGLALIPHDAQVAIHGVVDRNEVALT